MLDRWGAHKEHAMNFLRIAAFVFVMRDPWQNPKFGWSRSGLLALLFAVLLDQLLIARVVTQVFEVGAGIQRGEVSEA